MRWLILVLGLLLAAIPAWAQILEPRSPEQERATFQLEPGFDIHLAASEPAIVDPVAMCFDEHGRLFVCEMRGYPNGGVGSRTENRGRIKCLRDRDGDGIFETVTIFADGLRFPMGLAPWRGGVIVAVAPEILYLPDDNLDDRAESPRVLYTGFDLGNIQQMVNSLQWGADGWIHGVAGNNAGTITSPEAATMKPLTLQARGFRFRPDRPGSLEPMSGGGQYGLTEDEFGHWFTNTNSQHLRQIVIQDRYLRASRSSVNAVTLDIPEHGAACRVFRISPFEPWRLERTTRRVNSEMSKRFPSTELVAGGYTTSACSPLVYTGGLFPEVYHRSVFICDPANNLIMRDTLHPAGGHYTARRAVEGREFLASTDNWFRPVQVSLGPDGALYVLDFYREVIETPLSIPQDIQAKLNLESRERGRLWRIAPTGFTPKPLPNLAQSSTEDLMALLAAPNSWTRKTAQRLLQTSTKATAQQLRKLLAEMQNQAGVEHVLALLRDRQQLQDTDVATVLNSKLSGNREVGLRYVEELTQTGAKLNQHVAALADDPEPLVRFQVALTSARLPGDLRKEVLLKILSRDAQHPWMVRAVTVSAGNQLSELVQELLKQPTFNAGLSQLAYQAGLEQGRANPSPARDQALDTALSQPRDRVLVLDYLSGFADGLANKKVPLAQWLESSAQRAVSWAKWEEQARAMLASSSQVVAVRSRAAIFLGQRSTPAHEGALLQAVDPLNPPEVQLAALQSLGRIGTVKTVSQLIKLWPTLGPGSRRELLEQLFQRPHHLHVLLDEIQAGRFASNNLDASRLAALRGHPLDRIRERAAALFKETTSPRAEILKQYAEVSATGDVAQGKKLFQQHCASCHKIQNLGHEVGPQLEAVISGKTIPDLVRAILDPNQEVDPRYVNYLANTVDGKTISGLITNESAGSLTLTRADGIQETIRRVDLENLKSTGVSLMPEGFEQHLKPKDMQDLLAFLVQALKHSPAKK